MAVGLDAKKLAWFQNKVGTSYISLDGAKRAYFKSKSGLADGSINDHISATLNGLGYTPAKGSLNDRLRAFYKAKLSYIGDASFADLENLFYSNTALDFV